MRRNSSLRGPLQRICKATRGSSVVIAGDHQPAVVHAIAHTINAELGNVGKTVFYTDPVDANPDQSDRIDQRSRRRHRCRQSGSACILGGNPAYDAPADLEFRRRSQERQNSAARSSTGFIRTKPPNSASGTSMQAHELESWGDARAYDGTVSIIQPLIAPLYNGKSASGIRRTALRTIRCHRLRPRPRLLAEAAHRRRLRAVLAQVAARRLDRGHGLRAKIVLQRKEPRPSVRNDEPLTPTPSSSTSAATPPSTTDNSPTTAGCRNCPSR